MEIEMARPEPVAAVRRDRDLVAELPVAIVEDFQRTRFLGFALGRVVAARDQDDLAAVEADANLMAVNAGVDWLGLHDFRPRRAVGVDAVDPEAARIAERDQDMFGREIG